MREHVLYLLGNLWFEEQVARDLSNVYQKVLQP